MASWATNLPQLLPFDAVNGGAGLLAKLLRVALRVVHTASYADDGGDAMVGIRTLCGPVLSMYPVRGEAELGGDVYRDMRASRAYSVLQWGRDQPVQACCGGFVHPYTREPALLCLMDTRRLWCLSAVDGTVRRVWQNVNQLMPTVSRPLRGAMTLCVHPPTNDILMATKQAVWRFRTAALGLNQPGAVIRHGQMPDQHLLPKFERLTRPKAAGKPEPADEFRSLRAMCVMPPLPIDSDDEDAETGNDSTPMRVGMCWCRTPRPAKCGSSTSSRRPRNNPNAPATRKSRLLPPRPPMTSRP